MATLSSDINSRIPLYVRRTLGEKINVAIDFLRQNWRVALRLSIYLLLPLALMHSVGLFTFIKSITGDSYNSTDLGFLTSAVFSILSMVLVYTLILTLFQYYEGSTDGDLSMLSFRDVRGQLWRNFKRIVVILWPILAIIVLLSLMMFVIMFVPFFSLLVLAVFATLAFILMMAPIHYVLEDVNVATAFRRTFSHAQQSWGKLFGLMFALLLVSTIIESAVGVPTMVFFFIVENLSSSGEASFSLKLTFDIILYVFFILQSFFGYLSLALVVTTLVYHYGSNAREIDDLAIASDIENFANL